MDDADLLDPSQPQPDKAAQRAQQTEDMKWLAGHPQGRRIAWRLLERAGVFRSTFNTNAMTMAANEGTRSLGLFLLDELLDASPGVLTRMMQEHRG
jgi:hypothetical protein